VVWVDLLTPREFEQGFGSHTPIYSGQTKCVRYYMNFKKALELHKKVSEEASVCIAACPYAFLYGSRFCCRHCC
jgi:hypothetical protein